MAHLTTTHVSWLYGVHVILLLCSLYILNIFYIQLYLTLAGFLLKILCSLWDFGKCLLINRRKTFTIFVDNALLNGGLNQIIFRDLFFGFCHWFLVYLKSTLNLLFFRASSYSHFAVLNFSSLDDFFDSLSWMEFGSCFMMFDGLFDKLWM